MAIAERTIRCCCGGAIRNAESWKLGRYDWRWANWLFADGCRFADIDGVVERNGQFLVFETKRSNVPVDRGQQLLLDRLAALPEFTVIELWGDEPDEPLMMHELGKGGGAAVQVTRADVERRITRWWQLSAQASPKRRKSL